jgi:hypothetical protein
MVLVNNDAASRPLARMMSGWLGGLTLLAAVLASAPAHAHVKWFAEYDLTKPPLPIGGVIDGRFVNFFLASVIVIYGFFWIDRAALRRRILDDQLRRFVVDEPTAFLILRVSVFCFFTAVSIYGMTGSGFYLTPELKTEARWVPWVQLGIGVWALDRRTAPLTGLGIGTLYLAAVHDYGLFHLLDYQILIGLSYYFAASRPAGRGWITSRYIALYATTGLTLLWASIEKWGYAVWTFPLLEKEPDLLMGLEPGTYMVLAGFIEFNLTFMLLSSASLLSRAVALGFGSIFALAIFKFGMIDAVGHAPIIAILTVLVIYGPTKGRNFLVLEGKSLWTEAYFMTGLYVLAFVLIFTAYYRLHHIAYVT